MEEEGNTEDDSKEEKEENAESNIEVIKHADENHRRRNGTRAGYTNNAIGQNNIDKSQARRARTNELMRRRRTGKRLAKYARRTLRNQTGTNSGRTGLHHRTDVQFKGRKKWTIWET